MWRRRARGSSKSGARARPWALGMPTTQARKASWSAQARLSRPPPRGTAPPVRQTQSRASIRGCISPPPRGTRPRLRQHRCWTTCSNSSRPTRGARPPPRASFACRATSTSTAAMASEFLRGQSAATQKWAPRASAARTAPASRTTTATTLFAEPAHTAATAGTASTARSCFATAASRRASSRLVGGAAVGASTRAIRAAGPAGSVASTTGRPPTAADGDGDESASRAGPRGR
mmetsp:Transcript_14785/g.41863  ORF Transcript_14785/g.41863 Transcript_14785/m.41863 type:complete len:233 (-) Transcript_14785:73-771(-)